MHLTFRNVNDAFCGLVAGIHNGNIKTVRNPSRVGDVMQIPDPCIITFTNPRERVLFNQARDCNPFFHLYESLWMLAGRQDIAPLQYYSSGYAAQVQDGDDPNANGAYGYRWRRAPMCVGRSSSGVHKWEYTEDQLMTIVDHLKRKPESRRVVLQMWNVEDDLLKIDTSKDVCCNTAAYFSLREVNRVPTGPDDFERGPTTAKVLDMTVTNRSNDLIWGMLGANVVHFSFLQEYLAACIGVGVGVYNQFSNNLHAYVSTPERPERWCPEKWLADETPVEGQYRRIDLVKNPATFDRECGWLVELHSGDEKEDGMEKALHLTEPFLKSVAQPMMLAFHCHKQRKYDLALVRMGFVLADDWRIAGTNWILKRKAAWEAKQGGKDVSASAD
jgi:thymidylate synthase